MNVNRNFCSSNFTMSVSCITRNLTTNSENGIRIHLVAQDVENHSMILDGKKLFLQLSRHLKIWLCLIKFHLLFLGVWVRPIRSRHHYHKFWNIKVNSRLYFINLTATPILDRRILVLLDGSLVIKPLPRPSE